MRGKYPFTSSCLGCRSTGTVTFWKTVDNSKTAEADSLVLDFFRNAINEYDFEAVPSAEAESLVIIAG